MRELGLKVFWGSELLASCASKEGVFLGSLTGNDHQQAFTCDHHC